MLGTQVKRPPGTPVVFLIFTISQWLTAFHVVFGVEFVERWLRIGNLPGKASTNTPD